MKKTRIFLFILITSVAAASAQTTKSYVGVTYGVPATNIDASYIGASYELSYDLSFLFSIGINVSYRKYLGNDSGSFNEKERAKASILPLAFSTRYNVTEKLFLGSDVGFSTTTDFEDTGFYYRGRLGYHINDRFQGIISYSSINLEILGEIKNIGIGVLYRL